MLVKLCFFFTLLSEPIYAPPRLADQSLFKNFAHQPSRFATNYLTFGQFGPHTESPFADTTTTHCYTLSTAYSYASRSEQRSRAVGGNEQSNSQTAHSHAFRASPPPPVCSLHEEGKTLTRGLTDNTWSKIHARAAARALTCARARTLTRVRAHARSRAHSPRH